MLKLCCKHNDHNNNYKDLFGDKICKPQLHTECWGWNNWILIHCLVTSGVSIYLLMNCATNNTRKKPKWKCMFDNPSKNVEYIMNQNCVLYGLNFDTPQKCEQTWIVKKKYNTIVHEHILIMMFRACQTLMYLSRILVLACTLNN